MLKLIVFIAFSAGLMSYFPHFTDAISRHAVSATL